MSVEWLTTGTGNAPSWAKPKPGDALITVNSAGRELPILGTVAASDGRYTGIIDGADLPPYRWKEGRAMVQIHGDSAYPVIYGGQFAIVEPDRKIRHNNLVVLVLDDGPALVR